MNDVETSAAIERASGDFAALLGEHDSTLAALDLLGLDGDAVWTVLTGVVARTRGPVGTPQMLAAFAIGYLVGRDAT